MLNPRAQESKARTGRFLERRLISDYGQTSSYESQPGAANRQDSWGASQGNSGALKGRMLARAPASQLIKASTTMGPRVHNSFPFSARRHLRETPGLVDGTDQMCVTLPL